MKKEDPADFPQEKELFNQLKALVGSEMFGNVGTATKQSETAAAKPAEEKKEEEKKPKEAFDIELSGFDASKKIMLIKEIKNLLNIGLKEVTHE